MIHHRGTEDTEYIIFYPIGRRRLDKTTHPFVRKFFLDRRLPIKKENIFYSVNSVPLW